MLAGFCYHANVSLLLVAAFFLLGTLIASFVGVVVGRLYTGQGVVLGRSHCDACGTTLTPRTLIPIVSYILGSGRARCCGARLSPWAPVSELALGALFALAYLHLGLSSALPALLVALTLLTTLVLYDLAHQILPPPLLVLFVGASALSMYLEVPSTALLATTLTAGAFALFFALLWVVSAGRAMGLADTPLVFGLALLAGPVALTGFLFSFWIGALVGIVLLARTPRGARMGIEVPFAPFLAAGFLLAYFTQWDPFALSALIEALL